MLMFFVFCRSISTLSAPECTDRVDNTPWVVEDRLSMFKLVVSRGDRELVSLPVEDKTIRIGRSGTNDLSLPEKTVSRHHCQISMHENQVRLKDISGKGTRVDGKLTHHAVLKPGSRIELGSLTVTLSESERDGNATTLVSGATDALKYSEPQGNQLVLRGKVKDQEINLTLEGNHVSLGSDPGNQIILQDGYISSYHCRIFQKSGVWFVADLDSTNGTFVNNVRVGEARLEPGMILSLGKTRIHIDTQPSGADGYDVFGIVSADPGMQRVFDLVKRAAPTDQTVLITGESGSGKELVAKAIHRMSKRSAMALVTLNCSAITKELLESELFGHEKGAFTGAQTRRKGLFEEAHSGTLFLDEIGELAPEVQAKLLRVLENGEIRRVGSNQTIKTDVRLISATHRMLPEMVSKGCFREDLYYRICVIEIPIPPLRERPKDIPLLAMHFLNQVTRDIQPRRLTPKSVEKLLAYRYPGNVRELKHIITRAAILCPFENIEPDHLIFSPPTLADRMAESKSFNPGKTLVQVEIDAIRQALNTHNGNVSAAAKLLGISRNTLTRKLKKLAIEVDETTS